jgi:hypothetical protein
MKQPARLREISDKEIIKAWKASKSVKLSVKAYSWVDGLKIVFGNFNQWLPFRRVLPLVGITAPMLKSVFSLEKDDLLLDEIAYEQLGYFRLAADNFFKLAEILGKPIEVFREDDRTGEYEFLYRAYPNGKILERKDLL